VTSTEEFAQTAAILSWFLAFSALVDPGKQRFPIPVGFAPGRFGHSIADFLYLSVVPNNVTVNNHGRTETAPPHAQLVQMAMAHGWRTLFASQPN
jgi:hypothetical protein